MCINPNEQTWPLPRPYHFLSMSNGTWVGESWPSWADQQRKSTSRSNKNKQIPNEVHYVFAPSSRTSTESKLDFLGFSKKQQLSVVGILLLLLWLGFYRNSNIIRQIDQRTNMNNNMEWNSFVFKVVSQGHSHTSLMPSLRTITVIHGDDIFFFSCRF